MSEAKKATPLSRMTQAMGVLAGLRPSVFPPSQPGKSEAWALDLVDAGYDPLEVLAAVRAVCRRTKGDVFLDLGDFTEEIEKTRRTRALEARRNGADRQIAELTAKREARAKELEADGWAPYDAKVRAAGEIPNPISVARDRSLGITNGARRAIGGPAAKAAGAVQEALRLLEAGGTKR